MREYAYLTHGSVLHRQLRFRAFLACHEILSLVETGSRMLDVGGGDGLHARFFRQHGLQVDVIDLNEGMEPLVFAGEYERYKPAEQYDVVWCSHVYEHIINPGLFLSKIWTDLRPGGYAVITVPPMKSDMLFEHVTLWNPGLLLIHLIKCGFDCRQARVGSYHYNITVIAQRPHSSMPADNKDRLPAVEWNGGYFNGDIKFLNWRNQKLDIDPSLNFKDKPVADLVADLSRSSCTTHLFGMARLPDNDRLSYMYIDHEKKIVVPTA